MDITSLLGPAVVAALVSGTVSIAGFRMSAKTARATHTEKLAFDRDQTQRRVDIDVALAEKKANADIALAEKKLTLDWSLAAAKRRSDFAEDILADFYQARELITAARSPIRFPNELIKRKRATWETEEDSVILNAYYIPLDRLNSQAEFFAKMNAKKYRCIALFGHEIESSYDEIIKIRSDIIIAINMLTSSHKSVSNSAQSLGFPETDVLPDIMTWKATLGWPYSEIDPIEKRLTEIVKKVESLCLPALSADRI